VNEGVNPELPSLCARLLELRGIGSTCAIQSPPPQSCWATQSHRSCSFSAQSNSLTAISITVNTCTFRESSSNCNSSEICSTPAGNDSPIDHILMSETLSTARNDRKDQQQVLHFSKVLYCKHQPMAYVPREGRFLKVVQDLSVFALRERVFRCFREKK